MTDNINYRHGSYFPTYKSIRWSWGQCSKSVLSFTLLKTFANSNLANVGPQEFCRLDDGVVNTTNINISYFRPSLHDIYIEIVKIGWDLESSPICMRDLWTISETPWSLSFPIKLWIMKFIPRQTINKILKITNHVEGNHTSEISKNYLLLAQTLQSHPLMQIAHPSITTTKVGQAICKCI